MKKLPTGILTLTAAAVLMLSSTTQAYAGHHAESHRSEAAHTTLRCAYGCETQPNATCDIHNAPSCGVQSGQTCETGHTANCGHRTTAPHSNRRHHNSAGCWQ